MLGETGALERQAGPAASLPASTFSKVLELFEDASFITVIRNFENYASSMLSKGKMTVEQM